MGTNTAITGVVVFKNEAQRIQPLLHSILAEEAELIPWLFVNDHSTDNSVALIEEQLRNSNVNYTIIQNKHTGKKRGIDLALNQVTTLFAWLTDADTFFPTELIAHKKKLSTKNVDLQVGIIQYEKPKTLLQFWVYYETIALYYFVFNQKAEKLTTCNGANLLVNVNTYKDTRPYATNYHVPTGDDLFLLHAFKKRKANIYVDTEPKGFVFTQYPSNWSAFVNQRIRWASKNILLRDKASIINGIGFVAINLLWLTSLLFLEKWSALLLVKPIAEALVIKKLAKKTKQEFSFTMAFFICIIEPLLILCLLPPSILKGLSYKKVSSNT